MKSLFISIISASLICFLFVCSPPIEAQTTRHVGDDAPGDPGPGDPSVSDPLEDGSAAHPFDSIQEGIDAAVNGDTVLVADGTYTGNGNRDLDFNGKAITVKSVNGAESCIIDCEGGGTADPHRGFYFHTAEGRDSIVSGFTIRNGTHSPGAGIYCDSASPTITRNIITGNSGFGFFSSWGGGISLSESSAPITHNIVSENVAFFGAGIFASSSSPLIAHNTITGNITQDDGGGCGIFLVNSTAVVTDNTISKNHNLGNSAGGGIALSGDVSSIITNNIIRKNWASASGGGIFCSASSPTIMNNLIAGNGDGGGIFCDSSSTPLIASNTIAFNQIGAGIECDGSVPTVVNSIVWGNASGEIIGSPAVTYSDIQDGYTGTGNINEDPLFVKGPLGTYYLSQIAAGQASESPCVDAGTGVMTGPPYLPGQLAGTTRTDIVPDSGTIDMGYHYPLIGLKIPSGLLLEEVP